MAVTVIQAAKSARRRESRSSRRRGSYGLAHTAETLSHARFRKLEGGVGTTALTGRGASPHAERLHRSSVSWPAPPTQAGRRLYRSVSPADATNDKRASCAQIHAQPQ